MSIVCVSMCEREREGLITKLTKHSLGWMDRKAEVKTVGGGGKDGGETGTLTKPLHGKKRKGAGVKSQESNC